MTIIPQWTERISNLDVVGEDHLGIETAAATYQGELLPGIITVTDHARYYSFYCWILWRFIHDERHDRRLANLRGVYFKRLELAHTMACYAHHKGNLGGVIGSQRSGVIWRESDPIALDENTGRYFQHTLGGFGQYYLTAMRIMGLVGEQPNRHDVYQLTERGRQLAEAFEASIHHTRYYTALAQGDVKQLAYADAAEYAEAACLCANTLARGQDREPLREVLFRLKDGRKILPQHRARQLSLALLLDLVRQSRSVSSAEGFRPALYLGEYRSGQTYEPSAVLTATFARWRHVQARQLYTSALQIMWSLFLVFLQDRNGGVSLEDFMGWLADTQSTDATGTALTGPLAGILPEKRFNPKEPQNYAALASRYQFKRDALTIFEPGPSTSQFTLEVALQMLFDVFLRFYELDRTNDSVWQELAVSTQESHRLPLRDFFHAFQTRLEDNATILDVVKWLYQEYVLTQHEYMAIRKLRYNGYDTFKFHYNEGLFYPTGIRYIQPLRRLSLRLDNALTMLVDVGLVELEAETGVHHLTPDGTQFLSDVEAMNNGN